MPPADTGPARRQAPSLARRAGESRLRGYITTPRPASALQSLAQCQSWWVLGTRNFLSVFRAATWRLNGNKLLNQLLQLLWVESRQRDPQRRLQHPRAIA